MPKAYSGDLRERVIEAVETGCIATRGGRTFRGERELGDQVAAALARKQKRRAEAARRKRFSAGGVRDRILALVAEQPDLTLVETVAALRKRRIKTSRSSLWRFLDRHDITLKKKPASWPNGSARMWRERADVGCESKACLIPPGWCLSTRPRSAPTWCGSSGRAPRGESGDRQRSARNMGDNHLRGRPAPP